MEIQNNYILLRRADNEEKYAKRVDENGNNVIHLNIPVHLKTLINKVFDLKEEVWISDKLHFNYEVSFSLALNNIDNNITFEIFEVLGDCYFNVLVSGKTKVQCVKILEQINMKLYETESKIEKHFIVIISYDAVSEYYCNKIFAKFSNFERLFRRLLFNIYVLNYGNDYYKKTISQDIIDKAKGNIREKNKSLKKNDV